MERVEEAGGARGFAEESEVKKMSEKDDFVKFMDKVMNTDEGEKDPEGKVQDGVDPESTEENRMAAEDAKLITVSNAIKAIGKMTGVGISYVIVIPGYGKREDARLYCSCIPRVEERNERDVIQELLGNVSCMIDGLMDAMRKTGLSDGAVRGLINKAIEDAKDRYGDRWKPFQNAGAGPMGRGER